ncbi:MAG: arginine decarboxylase [Chloroflexi bacterium]|nr:arginine decarboxylase [Chloroflexota bacterium]MCI0644940.1 arginine decarboxylase [Chloroflexota bacterium]MCI0728401.1 arginine decarboxylase [Chloroflexota bacterium]
MTRPVIGWEQETPVPDHVFNDYLNSRNGRLFYEELDLAQLFLGGAGQGPGQPLSSPLEIVYLPRIRHQIQRMQAIFDQAIRTTAYEGAFYYAYASKANAAEEVIRTTLAAGAHHEMSSTVDVEIGRIMRARGLLPPGRLVICNGFKTAGSDYANNILRFKGEHANLIPVVEDLAELPPLIDSGLPFDVGLRQKSYGPHQDEAEMDSYNSRFGMDLATIWKTADYVAAAPNLNLRLYHAMVGSQIASPADFVAWLKPPMEIYARLRQRHPTLHIFNFGGGVPVAMTLDFHFDYDAFASLLLTTLQEVCGRYRVPVPDVMGEFGRYTTAEHGAHLFKIIAAKENNSALPWYIIDGSIMSSFPDSWALSEHFIVLPLNHLDQPFQQVQLGGITCDSDDVYPPKPSASPLYLPVETENLYIGFFGIGAYQEMLGGVKGSKHCVLPEASELIIDRDAAGPYHFEVLQGQTFSDVMRNLGYLAL